MKFKRGELTTQQIITLIILLVSFAVILFLLFRLNLGGESNKEICHNSVVLKANPALPADSVTLDCDRTYICVTEDGSCEGMYNPIVEKVKTLDEVYEVLANEMSDCWWMFGEGKVKYISDTVLERNYCSICSQILFDDSLNNIEGIEDSIDKNELYEYLANNEVKEGTTYSEYFFGTNDVESLKQSIIDEGASTDLSFGEIVVGEQYYVVMGIISQIGNTYKWIAAGVGVLALPVILSGSFVYGAVIAAGAGVAGTVGDDIAGLVKPEILALIVAGDGIENEFMAPTIIETNPEKFSRINCHEILTYT